MVDERSSRDTVTVAKVDHQVAVDEFTGGASIDVPVPLTAARALTPRLGLRWSGGGNSVVGRGWSLGGLPAITVDASEHLPRWDGRDGFALGGVPLVVWRADDGTPRRRIDGDYQVTDLRPRSGFTRVRVEHWVHRPTGAVHFRSRDEADVLTVFGARPGGAAQIADPDAPKRIAAWLPEVMIDPVGNALWCEYAAEDRRGIDRTAPWEPRRPSMAQRYLTRVRYGNVAPVALTADVLAGALPAVRFAFALVVDHGDHGDADGVPTFEPDRDWPARPDVFASARDGFSVRTYRRVRRLACFHDLPALGGAPVAVSALELGYVDDPAGAQLRTLRRVGYRDGVRATSAPLTLTYAEPGVAVSELATTSTGVVGAGKALVDLYGEGLPGVLYRGDRGWLYRSNRGGGRFTEPALVGARPSLELGAALGDLDRDGDTELAITTGRMAGAFALEREDARWQGFRPFARWPKIEAVAGHTYWIDLNGDGRADAVVARGDALVWFPSRSGPLDERDGEFGDAITVPLPTGSDRAPGGVPDPSLGLTFADLDGDGLPDLVRVQRGGVEYWPSLGNGRFGERMAMSGATELGQIVDFDHRRVRWVDLDGSGTADLVYLRHGEVWLWPNHGGRRFGPLQRLRSLPQFDARTAMITDVAGQGRPSLVWTTPDLGRGTTLSYLPLAPAIAPGTVTAIDDGCGHRTELTWGSSATHYLRDAAEGVPWETRLPGHRAVVDARVERELVGGTSVTTRYRYRDGFYDGATGAFRGFGRVETLDTPAVGATPEGAAFAPPLLTRTWFHLGTPMRNHHRPFAPYTGDASLPTLPAHVDLPGLHAPADHAAARRLLAGAVVRRERWAVDAQERPTAHPFDVEQVSHQLVQVQARHGRARPVFAQLARERLVAAYEGSGGDPRVTHDVVVAFDPWGAPTRTATVAYARRGAVEDPAQARTWVTVTDARRTSIDASAQFALGLVVEETQLELVGVAAGVGRMTPGALASVPVSSALAAPVPLEQALDPGAAVPAARRLSWQRTYYWSDARDGAAPLGEVGRTPRRHHVDEACLTPGLIAATLGARVDDAQLAALGYVAADGHWWVASPREDLAGPFALAAGSHRGDGATTKIAYDADWLSPESTTDALGLTTAIAIDPVALQPATTTDPNGTVAEVVRDRFGRIVATGIVGHVGGGPWSGGTTASWQLPAEPRVAQILADPAGWLGNAATATWVDDRAWERDGTPIAEITVARSALVSGGGDSDAPLDVRIRYVDGFGRVLQEKVKVEAGPAITRGPSGDVIVDDGGRPVLTHSATRWRVSGHVVFDAKGQPGRMYEPYFSPTAAYEGDAVLEHFGVSTLTTYDALGRAVRVDLPNGSYTRSLHAAWSTEVASPSDTVQDSVYRALREGRPADDPERAAYLHAAAHAGTPVVSMVDARGLACATRAIGDATAATVAARSVLDATGQVAALVDGRGLEAFSYARDLRGRVLAQRSVDAGSTWALADAYSRAVWSWDARGFAVERRFDHADRPVAVHVRGGDGASAVDAVVETYRYGDELADRAGAIAANALGRAVLVRDEAGELEVETYDPLGAVRTRTRRLRALLDDTPDWRGDVAIEAEAFTTATRTDALGRTVWTQLADGTIRREAFHPGGALAAVRLTTPDGALLDAPIVSGLERDAHGRIAAATLGNGCVQTWRYDVESGQLAAQDAVHDGRALQALRYTYDPDGKLVRALDLAQEGPGALVPGAVSARRDYRYDAYGRLLEATGRVHQALLPHDGPATAGCIHGARHISLDNGAALERYTQRLQWDSAGNLARVQHIGATASWATDYWISPTSNRASPALDENGNPIIAPETLYDAGGNLNRLWHLRTLGHSWRACLTHAVTVARAAGPVDDGERYAYAVDRVRARKVATRLVVGGDAPVIETREVVYLDGGQERVRVRRGDQLVLERFTTHVSDGDRRVAVVDRHVVDTLGHEVNAIGPARVRYHLTTAQGSTSLELDELARLISYEEYLPHGGSAFIAGDSVREVARRDIRYAGKERDRSTGLHAYPQRYYAPWLGRWLTPDPLGLEDGLNLYAFVGGDPIGYVDPDGTDRKPAGLRQVATEDPAIYHLVNAGGVTVGIQHYDLEAKKWETEWGEPVYVESTAPLDVEPPVNEGGVDDGPLDGLTEGMSAEVMCQGRCYEDADIEAAIFGPRPQPSAAEAELQKEMSWARDVLAKKRARYSDKSWGAAPAETFYVYSLILDEIEDSARTGDPIDTRALWDRAHDFNWDFPHIGWMYRGSRNGPDSFSSTGVYGGQTVWGVDPDLVFAIAISDSNPKPTTFEKTMKTTGKVMEFAFLFTLMGGPEMLGLGGAMRLPSAPLGVESTALRAEATVLRAETTALRAEATPALPPPRPARTVTTDSATVPRAAPSSAPPSRIEPALSTAPRYETQRLRSMYEGENLRPFTWHGKPTTVRYLNDIERQGYLLTARDGKLYNARGELFDTTMAKSEHAGGGHAIFVMDANGNIYASTAHKVGEFHHSSLLAGQPVAGAGELVVENGIVLTITRASGHYWPSEALMNQVLTQLKKHGIQPKNVVMGF